MTLLLIRFDFLNVRVIDLIDIFLVSSLIYFLYKLLRGTIAVSIFMGLMSIYFIWLIVRMIGMQLLSTILGQFIGVGVIALIIVFQQEIRKFLLIIGQSNVLSTDHLTFRSILPWNWKTGRAVALKLPELTEACEDLSKTKTGALIVLAKAVELKGFASTGTAIDSELSAKLLKNIFFKNTPLHDGAVIIAKNRIKAASCILPVSDNPNLPNHLGLRHRAGVGMSEQSDAMVIIISEQTGSVSLAQNGQLTYKMSLEELHSVLEKNFF